MSFKHKRRPKHRGTENTEGHRDLKNGFKDSFPSFPSSSLGTHLSRRLLSPETALCLQATSSLLEAGASRTMALPSWSLVTRGTTGTATSGINGN